jgi:predicted phosphodiesterase
MRIGVLSDIHAMDRDLEYVLGRMEDCALVVNLGDVAGYQGDVNRCIRMLSTPRIVNLLGDQDLEILSAASGEGLERPPDYGVSPAHKELVRGFKRMRKFKVQGLDIGFTHGRLVRENGLESWDRAEYYNAIEMFHEMRCRLIFVGHSCVPRVLVMDPGAVIRETEMEETTRVDILPGHSYIFDAGSVTRRSFAILHLDDPCVVAHLPR